MISDLCLKVLCDIMDTRSILISLLILGIAGAVVIGGSSADGNTSTQGQNVSLNLSLNTTNTTADRIVNLSSPFSDELLNQTGGFNQTDETAGAESADEESAAVDNQGMYSGTGHPNEDTDVQSSTPSGDPLLNEYALGGVSIDIGAHLMEARGNDSNVSSEITLKDHTSANGYIRTIQKDFHYESKVDTPQDL
ncbi:hypothetical protein [uncultured Methanospirillum sp.]|uniref:hypothetical protein n=1 Tax=uncultured Methanospirillum sp. TaxID=262503 RepID=UPI003748E4AE